MINHRNQINLEEETDRNMKGKFKLLGHIGLTLFLVSALVLTLAPVAQAATAVTEVWVDFPGNSDTAENETSESAGNIYIIHFKPTTALSRGVDTVTVTFPDGSAAMCGTASTARDFTVTSADETDVYFSTDYGTLTGTLGYSSATWYRLIGDGVVGGYRVKVKTPIDVAAGQDVWIRFICDDDDTVITSCETEATTYKVKVATSQDTTPVLSSAFPLGTTAVTTLTVTPLVTTAGITTQYIASWDDTEDVAVGGTVTLKFPLGTTMPSTISTSDVLFSNDASNYSNATAVSVDADLRTITGTTPIILDDSGSRMKILSSAGVGNPQTAATIASDTIMCMISTSSDARWFREETARVHGAGTATQVLVANGEIGEPDSVYSDDATMINMISGKIYVTMADQYGNAKAVTGGVTVNLTTSSGTGTFYTSSDPDPGSGDYSAADSLTVTTADPASAAQQVYYKDSTAGTHTLTFSCDGYTSATWEITVAPAVSLYDANNNLVNTYGATSTSPVAEIADQATVTYAQKYGVDYINDAITAAFAGDTVKLGDGIYELDAAISLDEKITLTSVNGASSTTLRPTTDIDKAINVATAGDSTNPVVIDGLTFQWLRYLTDIECAVYDDGKDYLTVQNCVFNNIEPDQGSSHEGVIWVRDTAALTSITISDNSFNDCVTTWPNMGSDYTYSGCIIHEFSEYDYDNSGITVSGNTLTDCGQYGITIGGHDGTFETKGDITNNTIINGQCAICVANQTDGVNITGNTITDAYSYGVYVEGSNNDSLVIKNNTITGCAGEYYFGGSTTEHGGAIVVEEAASATDPVIQYNTITGSGSYAIKVDAMTAASPAAANCKYNWFGDASGPYYSALTGARVTKSNPNGTGDKITDYVVYYPWLYKSRADVVADNVSYQTSNMKLVSGWNTMSTPVKLISTADSIDELIPSGMSIGYYYDGGWQLITTGYVLSPCDAVYVKMEESKYVQFKFDAGAFTTPSKSLDAGWSLISLASLDSSKDATDAVASVDLTAGNLPGWSQLISPSMNAAQTDIYGATETAWSESSGQDSSATMQPGLGYWIYMQNAATLAGFTITPIVPDLD
jgi:hypothetical protein